MSNNLICCPYCEKYTPDAIAEDIDYEVTCQFCGGLVKSRETLRRTIRATEMIKSTRVEKKEVLQTLCEHCWRAEPCVETKCKQWVAISQLPEYTEMRFRVNLETKK